MPRSTARYPAIAEDLRARILAGEWHPGTNLPRAADLAGEYQTNKDTMGRAIALLESEGLVWAVPRRGTEVRYGMSRPRRPRGNIVKRNVATDGPGYCFPSASGQEVWMHHITPIARLDQLTTNASPGCSASPRAPTSCAGTASPARPPNPRSR